MLIKGTCLTLGVLAMSFSLSGCHWQDDFRSRVHPQYERPEPKPTFNADSDEYVGDEIAKGVVPEGREPKLEKIDDLSKIPEVPEKPTPMN